jgi:hypothetical protein
MIAWEIGGFFPSEKTWLRSTEQIMPLLLIRWKLKSQGWYSRGVRNLTVLSDFRSSVSGDFSMFIIFAVPRKVSSVDMGRFIR